MRPSEDRDLNEEVPNAFWGAIENIFDKIAQLKPVDRWNPELLRTYISDRQGYKIVDLSVKRSTLPKAFQKLNLGAVEIDVLDILLH